MTIINDVRKHKAKKNLKISKNRIKDQYGFILK